MYSHPQAQVEFRVPIGTMGREEEGGKERGGKKGGKEREGRRRGCWAIHNTYIAILTLYLTATENFLHSCESTFLYCMPFACS